MTRMEVDTRRYKVRNANSKGIGVYATQQILAGETIMVGVIKEELSGNTSHATQISLNRYVIFDGDIIFINHSCAPNAGIKINAQGGQDIVAMRKISSGEEICFDYAMRNYSVDYFSDECKCGAPKCRKRITGWKDLPDDRKAAYTGFIAPYLLELDER